MKYKYFMWLLLEKDVIGKVVGYNAVIEFQKRGLPHAHILLIFNEENSTKKIHRNVLMIMIG